MARTGQNGTSLRRIESHQESPSLFVYRGRCNAHVPGMSPYNPSTILRGVTKNPTHPVRVYKFLQTLIHAPLVD
jgi:hypothetical protein